MSGVLSVVVLISMFVFGSVCEIDSVLVVFESSKYLDKEVKDFDQGCDVGNLVNFKSYNKLVFSLSVSNSVLLISRVIFSGDVSGETLDSMTYGIIPKIFMITYIGSMILMYWSYSCFMGNTYQNIIVIYLLSKMLLFSLLSGLILSDKRDSYTEL